MVRASYVLEFFKKGTFFCVPVELPVYTQRPTSETFWAERITVTGKRRDLSRLGAARWLWAVVTGGSGGRQGRGAGVAGVHRKAVSEQGPGCAGRTRLALGAAWQEELRAAAATPLAHACVQGRRRVGKRAAARLAPAL